jgi:transcriptional regulator with XRE-family HTH domain
MNGELLHKERVSRNWEQAETAARLKVSQPYLSLLEAGKRPVTAKLARRAVRVFDLPPTALPVENAARPKTSSRTSAEDLLASQLASLGYPKFSHLKKTKLVNPAVVLTSALKQDDLESRVVEALPWLIFNFSDMDWSQVVSSAKLADAQNRLGFLVSLAHEMAKRTRNLKKKELFKDLLETLEKSRLVHYDSFRRKSMTKSEQVWLRKTRPREARHWRVLSNLSANHLSYAANNVT